MEFSAVYYLALVALVPALLGLYGYGLWRQRQALTRFADAAALARLVPPSNRARLWLRALCLAGAVASLALALAQPRWGRSLEGVQREGRDIFIVLDTSLSMLAEDVRPNRLGYAKEGIRRLVELLRQEGGHRLGLVAFAGRANLHCPLTLDYNVFLQKLAEVNTETVPRKGTLIGEAVLQILHGYGSVDYAYTDMILVTDGDDHGSFPIEAARAAKVQRVGLYTVGVGDPSASALIPLTGADGRVEYLKYKDFNVRTPLRQSLLLELAHAADGTYQSAATEPQALERLYQTHIADKPRRPLDQGIGEGAAHRFQWFLAAALMLLIIDLLLRERRI